MIRPQRGEAIAAAALFLAIVFSASVAVDLKPKEKYTEFFLLGEGGRAGDYPKNLKLGSSGNVTIGMANHEQEKTEYLLRVGLDGEEIFRTSIELSDGEEKLQNLTVKPSKPGKQKLEFDLYKGSSSKPHASLRLYLEVVK